MSRLPSPVRRGAKRAVKAFGGSRLDLLAQMYGTDKGANQYLPLYKRHLGTLRKKPIALLEIGVLGGASLRMWRAHFRRGEIVGIDIEPKVIEGPRIHTCQGSQDDPEFLASVIGEFGPFDIVIDDGSHIGRHMITSFENLFPTVKTDGWYVVEDIGTAYWPDYEGGPPGTPGTAVAMVKGLMDAVNSQDVREGFDELPWAGQVKEMHIYPAIVFIQKR